MPRGKSSPKPAITQVHERIRAAAASEGISMTSAAREALRRKAGLAAVAKWEKQHGPFSAEEMEEAHRSVRPQLPTVRRPA
jgi:hypothetical protein